MPNIGEKVRDIISKKPKLAIFVDGPNVLRKDVNLSLKQIKERMSGVGAIKISKVFLNQNASNKLIEAAVNEGYEVVSTPSDVDVCMAVDATDVIHNPNINVIVLVTRDTDFHFVLKKAKEHGKTTIVVATKSNFSSALKNTADEVLIMDDDGYRHDKADETKSSDEKTKEAKEKELKEKESADDKIKEAKEKELKEKGDIDKKTKEAGGGKAKEKKEDKADERDIESKKALEKEKSKTESKKESKVGLIEKLSKRIKGRKDDKKEKEKTEQKK